MQAWYELRVPVNEAIADSLANFLFEQGCLGIHQSQNTLIGYFPVTVDAEKLRAAVSRYRQALAELGLEVPAEPLRQRTVKSRDWQRLWKRHFKPVRVTERLLVKPSWRRTPSESGAVVITIDPKQAFGTGTHESTQLGLQAVERSVRRGDRVLDVGTGTGILAIAALKLGAAYATALDIDPEAVEAARENGAANDVLDRLTLFTGDLAAIADTTAAFDVVTANLDRRTILACLPALVASTQPGRELILAGLLEEDEPHLAHPLAHLNTTVKERLVKNDWLALTLRRG